MTARKAAKRKGTIIADAAFMPASTITSDAVTMRARPKAETLPMTVMAAF
jgi:hypothetical protein